MDGSQKKIETNRTKMKSLTPVSKEIYLLKLQVGKNKKIMSKHLSSNKGAFR